MKDNDMIILEETAKLLELGKIGKDEEIHTFKTWLKLGRKPGKFAPVTRLEIKDNRGFKRWTSFWSTSQTESIERKVS